jgi:hypothetical protein
MAVVPEAKAVVVSEKKVSVSVVVPGPLKTVPPNQFVVVVQVCVALALCVQV